MERRVFILAPSGKDAQLIAAALERSHFAVLHCTSAADVVEQAEQGVGALLVAEEALSGASALQLQRFVERQPSWSDLPVLLLTSHGGRLSERAAAAVAALGNVTVLERPTQIATLVSAVRTSLRTRDRQYEMRKADARKDMFLATLAHELRNPLAPLSNALYLLQSEGAAAAQHRLATGVMHRQIRQLTRLVDDLLDVARITRGKIELQQERLDLRDVLHSGVETTLPLIDAMGHRLTVDLPEAPVWVDGDRTRLAQCVANLLANAAKYTPPKGRVEVSMTARASEVEIRVSDSGIGFPPQDARRLFEVFAQVDRAMPRAQGGLGLGLSIVKALAEMHGGSVQAHSAGEGRGATFSLHLMRAPASPEPEQAIGVPVAASPDHCRVLVVDDNRDSADSMAALLEMLGHEVRTAYDGRSGLALLETWTPHLALLDIGLPDISGHQFARRVRERLGPQCPLLVAVTGWGQAVDVARSAEAGFDHHLTKPASIDALLALVASTARAGDGDTGSARRAVPSAAPARAANLGPL